MTTEYNHSPQYEQGVELAFVCNTLLNNVRQTCYQDQIALDNYKRTLDIAGFLLRSGTESEPGITRNLGEKRIINASDLIAQTLRENVSVPYTYQELADRLYGSEKSKQKTNHIRALLSNSVSGKTLKITNSLKESGLQIQTGHFRHPTKNSRLTLLRSIAFGSGNSSSKTEYLCDGERTVEVEWDPVNAYALDSY